MEKVNVVSKYTEGLPVHTRYRATYPKQSAIMTLQFFIKVLPKISIMTSIIMTEKPKPMKGVEPYPRKTSPF